MPTWMPWWRWVSASSRSRFSAFVEFDREHARSSLAALMERGVLLVAESAGCLAGAIVGLMAPLWFNPTVSVAAELGWWVDEGFEARRPA